MKPFLLLLASLSLLPFTANAGNMFGPAAFRNGSPLVSGNDGTYQATARAENVTGIFRFAYSGGSQTANSSQNSWIFFIQGQIQKGVVQASLSGSNLNGILDSSSSTTTSSNSTISLPYIVLNQNNNSAGTFSGKLQQKSPNGAFSGQGFLTGLPATDGQVLSIAEATLVVGTGATRVERSFIDAQTTPYRLAGGHITNTSFNFRGVRTSTSSNATTNSASTTAN